MVKRVFIVCLCFFQFMAAAVIAQKTGGDQILGQWRANEKTFVIEFYKSGAEYRARIVTFTDHHSDIPSAERVDSKNPDPALRNRKVLGIDILTGLHYIPGDAVWSGGKIYDVGSGKTYSAKAELEKQTLTVRAYKGFSMLGKSFSFSRAGAAVSMP